ncbi:MAG: hypothetical protein SWZ49_09645, partial [Cyanobacteriota bacterium]|nr:hypothetical protein [Cyanobacteriota bacterium]
RQFSERFSTTYSFSIIGEWLIELVLFFEQFGIIKWCVTAISGYTKSILSKYLLTIIVIIYNLS